MLAALLHLDDALMAQPRLCQAVDDAAGAAVDCRDLGPQLRLWSRPPALRRLGDRLAADLPAGDGPAVVFCGSGDFHHVTPLLLRRALQASPSAAVTVVHFDNHPDWVRFSPGAHCGSWVGQVARMPQVDRVLTIGVCSDDIQGARAKNADVQILQTGRLELYAYRPPGAPDAVEMCGRRWPTIASMGEAAFLAFLPSRIRTRAVYVTIDKDVLARAEAGTNWDQGCTSVAFLIEMLARALSGRQLIGADVVGDWSAPRYGGGLVASLLKRAEAALDQPHRPPPADVLSANESVNLALLDQLTRAA